MLAYVGIKFLLHLVLNISGVRYIFCKPHLLPLNVRTAVFQVNKFKCC